MAAMRARRARIARKTNETNIGVSLNLDGKGKASVKTGIPFFDHMLVLFAKHATMDLKLRCAGDLAVDAHHTVEDCGIALGQAFATALGDKRGLRRYGWFAPRPSGKNIAASPGAEAYVPMDECLARCVVDFAAGRIWSGAAWTSFRKRRFPARRNSRTCRAPSVLGWPGNSFRLSPTRRDAICTWNCCTETSRITSSRHCSRHSRGPWMPPAGATRALPAGCPARKGSCETR